MTYGHKINKIKTRKLIKMYINSREVFPNSVNVIHYNRCCSYMITIWMYFIVDVKF